MKKTTDLGQWLFHFLVGRERLELSTKRLLEKATKNSQAIIRLTA
jgi:hypothetical protein